MPTNSSLEQPEGPAAVGESDLPANAGEVFFIRRADDKHCEAQASRKVTRLRGHLPLEPELFAARGAAKAAFEILVLG